MMKVNNAIYQFQVRLDKCDFKEQIPEYIQAMELAVKALEAQLTLMDVVNDILAHFKEEDSFSERLVLEILDDISIKDIPMP